MEDTAKDGMWEWRAYAACSDTPDYTALEERAALSHTLGREDPEVLALISSRFGVMSRLGKRVHGAKQTSVQTTQGPKHKANRVNDKARAPQLLLCRESTDRRPENSRTIGPCRHTSYGLWGGLHAVGHRQYANDATRRLVQESWNSCPLSNGFVGRPRHPQPHTTWESRRNHGVRHNCHVPDGSCAPEPHSKDSARKKSARSRQSRARPTQTDNTYTPTNPTHAHTAQPGNTSTPDDNLTSFQLLTTRLTTTSLSRSGQQHPPT